MGIEYNKFTKEEMGALYALRDIIEHTFTWNNTRQGQEYWNDVFDEIERVLDEY